MRVTSPPLSDKQKRYLKRSKGIKAPFSLDMPERPVVKVREYYAPVDLNFVPRKPRGSSGCRLSHEKRLFILQKHEKRVAFFAELGVRV